MPILYLVIQKIENLEPVVPDMYKLHFDLQVQNQLKKLVLDQLF